MCGIAGIYNRNAQMVDGNLLQLMASTIVHRGPDEEGFYINEKSCGNVGLAHRRLSIIDLASGQQPLCNEDRSIWITFNGEIYNFHELKLELENRGHCFGTSSDTETIVHAYEEWGLDAIAMLRGMFAFAIWDDNKQQMILARDRVGKKPLYYFLDHQRLVFASELKAILETGGIARTIDLTALSDYISLRYIPCPKTIFESVRKLPPAHFAVITDDSFSIKSYWDLDFTPGRWTSESLIMEGLLENLEESTRIRMISDVPLGAFLSGGIDSSAVVGMMSKLSSDPVKTSSISFGVSKYNEIAYARKVAKLFNTELHEMEVTPDALSVIEKLAWHYDEPFADSSAVPTFYVSRTARDNVTVSLSGDGGDENFAGYRRYYFDMKENAVRNIIPDRLRQPVFGTMGRLYPKADYLPQIFRGKAFISNVARDPVDAYYFSVSAVDDDVKSRMLNPSIVNSLSGYESSELFHQIYDNAPAEDHLSKIQYLDIKTYLCEDILTKVDRASMAVSLEVRCPILDHKFMEYAAKIPSTLKLKGHDGKHIFKKALKSYLPEEILYRKKMGFSIPVLEWLRKDLKEYARKLVFESPATDIYFNRAFLEKVWKEHQASIRDWSSPLWAVMMFNLWHQKFMEVAQ